MLVANLASFFFPYRLPHHLALYYLSRIDGRRKRNKLYQVSCIESGLNFIHPLNRSFFISHCFSTSSVIFVGDFTFRPLEKRLYGPMPMAKAHFQEVDGIPRSCSTICRSSSACSGVRDGSMCFPSSSITFQCSSPQLSSGPGTLLTAHPFG